MRIAFVTFEYPPFIIGGAGTYAEKVTCELAKLGHEIFVFTPQIDEFHKETINVPNLKIIRVHINGRLPFKALQFWLRLPEEIKIAEQNGKFDIIHFNGISYWFLKKKLVNAPHIVTIHHLVIDAIKSNNLSTVSRFKDLCGENSLIIPWIEKRCIHSADKIIAVSNFTKEQILKNYNIEPGKTSVIYNGIDLLIAAYSELVKDMQDTKLAIVGPDDGYLSELKKQTTQLGIVDKVLFTGPLFKHDKLTAYVDADVFVTPKFSGLPVTFIEACACGLPIITTTEGDDIAWIDNNVGFVVEYDKYSIYKAILKILQDGILWNDFSKNGKKLALQELNWDKIVMQMISNVYEGCVNNT